MGSAGLSPKNPRDYVGPNVFLVVCVQRNRRPTGADYRQPETGKLYPINSFWQVGKNPTTGAEGEIWVLSKIVANVAFWVMLSGGIVGPLLNVTVPLGVSPIEPDGFGTMNFTSTAGTIAITGSSASPNNHNINFDLVGGSTAIDQIQVQAATLPGVNPVSPDANGLMTVNGSAVANHSVPVETRTRALNTYNVEIQYATSAATTDATKSGLAHFNTGQFTVDANGFVTGLVNPSIGATNLGFTYAAGTFTVIASDGSALSATNFSTVTFRHPTTFSTLITRQVITPYTFTDDAGTDELGANLFGTTTGVAWGSDCPFYLYAILKNTTFDDVAFAISRVPNIKTSPVAGKLAAAGTTLATTQGSMFLLEQNGSTPTVADYASSSVVCLGSFRMRKTSADAWTVQALNASGDGVDNYNENTTFTYPIGQNGAASTNHFATDGGTQPRFATEIYVYTINRLGLVNAVMVYGGNFDVNGVGLNAWQPTFPLALLLAKNSAVGWYASASSSTTQIWAVTVNTDTTVGLLQSSNVINAVTQGLIVPGDATSQYNIDFFYQSSVT